VRKTRTLVNKIQLLIVWKQPTQAKPKIMTTTQIFLLFALVMIEVNFQCTYYDNETAKAIAHHVGTQIWRFPIYHFDDYDN